MFFFRGEPLTHPLIVDCPLNKIFLRLSLRVLPYKTLIAGITDLFILWPFSKVYSVMQSDGNSFGGDLVLDSFNKTFLDEDNNLDQVYKSKYVLIISVMILILYNIMRKCILTTVAQKPNFMSSLLLCAVVL